LEDDQNGNNHNDLFYGPNGTGSHNTNQEVGACDTPEWHPYKDPGYQINSNALYQAVPAKIWMTAALGHQVSVLRWKDIPVLLTGLLNPVLLAVIQPVPAEEIIAAALVM